MVPIDNTGSNEIADRAIGDDVAGDAVDDRLIDDVRYIAGIADGRSAKHQRQERKISSSSCEGGWEQHGRWPPFRARQKKSWVESGSGSLPSE
jgi:hypothetical protein